MKPENLEALYRLTPTQEGILFHSLGTSGGADAYLLQTACELRGELDAAAFRRAWEGVVARHAALRTSFQWEALDKPVQVVSRAVTLPWEEHDWRGLGAAERERRWEELRRDDRARLDLTRPPLSRLTLVRTEDEAHRFLWTYHHILLDGWSLPIVFREVFALYEGRSLAPARPFGAYVAWLKRRDAAADEAYWREALGGFTAPTPLPEDRPRAAAGVAGASVEGDERAAELPAAATAALVAFARGRQLTLSNVVQGAWGLLLARLAGEDDVVFGATFSGRSAPLPGIGEIVGPFLNVLPVRVKVQGSLAADTWLRRLQDERSRQLQHEATPLVEAQGWSGVRRGLPLFESLVTFENYPVEGAAGPEGIEISLLPGAAGAPYPLSLLVFEGERLAFRLGFDRARFDRATAARLLACLERLLAALAADPAVPVAELPLLGEAERAQLLVEWNDTAAGHPDVCLHELFARQAARTPDAVAVSCEGRETTYAELDRRSSRLAARLRTLGVGPEVRVGVCMERSAELVAALLGVLKAGGAYVPLAPDYPAERLAAMLEDSRAAVLVTQESLAGALPATAAAVLALDPELDALDDPPEEAGEGAAVLPENLAYVLFTSGSTGRPKGAMIPHAAISRHMLWMQSRLPLGPGDCVLQKTPISFDASVWEFWAPLLAGARLAVAPGDEHRDPPRLVERLRAERATVVQVVPALLRMLVDEPGLAACRGLRRVCCGGEPLPRELAAALLARLPVELVNLYGPTETTINASSRTFRAGSDLAAVPIGRPIEGARLHVVDRGLSPLPVSVAGELLVAGGGVGRGYLGRPELTAERFIPDPFGGPGERAYRTGDLCRFLPDGEVDLLGRVDHQVKVRGHRVEPGEVEAALREQPGVRDAVVLARPDAAGELRLAAWIVPDGTNGNAEGGGLPVAALREALRRRFPEPMVPAAWTALAALPLAPNGKVDRRALPDPVAATPAAAAPVAPRDETERAVAGLWRELLGVPEVGVHDDFFDLGGHSLLINRLRSRLQAAFGVDLPLAGLFAGPTVAEMAAAVRRAVPGGSAPLRLAAVPRQRHSVRRGDLAQKG